MTRLDRFAFTLLAAALLGALICATATGAVPVLFPAFGALVGGLWLMTALTRRSAP